MGYLEAVRDCKISDCCKSNVLQSSRVYGHGERIWMCRRQAFIGILDWW